MAKIKAKISWLRLTPLQQAAFARGTVSAMTGNASFATPTITLAAMSTAATRLETAWGNRNNGKVAQDEFKNAEIDLNAKLHSQAEYVSGIANGVEQVVHSAGFDTTTPATNRLQRIAMPEAPSAPELTPVVGGTVKVMVNKVANAKIYHFVMVTDGSFSVGISNGIIDVPTGVSASIISTSKRQAEFTALTAGKSVQVGVLVSNSTGTSAFSSVISTYVL